MPTQTGPVWQIAPIGQMKPLKFTKLASFLNRSLTTYFTYIQNGFFCSVLSTLP